MPTGFPVAEDLEERHPNTGIHANDFRFFGTQNDPLTETVHQEAGVGSQTEANDNLVMKVNHVVCEPFPTYSLHWGATTSQ